MSEPVPNDPAGGKGRILAVQDSPTQATRLKSILERHGYHVETCGTGEEALQRWTAEPCDLALLDVVLPDMTGYQVCGKIREARGVEVPVILLTSLDDPSNIIRGLEAGAKHLLVKPFEEEQLLSRIESALSGRDSHGDREPRQERRRPRQVETSFRGTTYTLTASPEHVLDYLVATFEDILYSRELLQKTILAEQAAQESRRFLQSAMDALSGLIAVLDENGVLLSVNKAWRTFARANGYEDPTAGVGSAYLDVCEEATGADRDTAVQAAEACRRVAVGEQSQFHLEYACGPAGQERWFTLHVTRFQEAEPARVVVVHHDISDRKSAEDGLRRSESEYRELVEKAMYGIYKSNVAGEFLMVNPALVEMLGYDSEKDLMSIGSAAELYAYPEERTQQLGKIGRGEDAEFEAVSKDGRKLTLRVSGSPVGVGPDGGTVFQGFVQDITQQVALEEQLRQAQRLEALGQLAGGVAHDFNNILSVIIGEAQLGMKRLEDDDPMRDRLTVIKAAGERAAGLTRQLLAFSRDQVVKPVVLDLNALVTDISSMLSRLIAEDIRLTIATQSRLGSVLVDKGQMEQVLTNLVVNARDAMPKGGELAIRTVAVSPDEAFLTTHPALTPQPYAVLEVEDTGTGITDEVRERMFDPFFTTKGRHKGTGLGLATAYGLVQKMDGHIEVDTELEVGTTMRIFLPVVDEEVAQAASVESALPLGTETVLLAEDDVRLRRIAVQLLEEHGYTVLSAEDGPHALEQLKAYDGAVHLLLTDVVMPNMGGREVAERVKEMRPDTKVLFMSGYTDDEVLRERLSTGDIAFLQKPFTAESLAVAVRTVLDDGA